MFKKLRMVPVAIPLVIMGAIIIISFISGEQFIDIMTNFFVGLMSGFGWIVLLVVLSMVIFLVVLFVHPIGNTKFGGPDAKPKYKTWMWFAISLCAGIGSGIVFWGATEPLMHSFNPPLEAGVVAGTTEAIVWGMSKSFLHWCLSPYAIYVVPGVVIGYAYYNMHKAYSVSSGLVFLNNGKDLNPKLQNIIDGFTMFALVGGVAGSLGYTVMQMGSSMDSVFGLGTGPMMWTILAVGIIAFYTISSATGLNKGLAWIADKNAWIYMVLLVFMILVGPASYIANLTTQSFGNYISNFIELSTFTSPVVGGTQWAQWWDEYWMVDWMSFGTLMGLFFVKLAHGRTIREFIVVNLFMPALFGVIWFGVFGGFAIHLQIAGVADMVSFLNEFGPEAFMMNLFNYVPGTLIVQIVMLITIILSIVTCCDSMTQTLSSMSLKHAKDGAEAPLAVKLFWGILIGAVSLIFVLSGGIEGIKIVKTIAGFPIVFLELIMMLGFIYHMVKKRNKRDEVEYADLVKERNAELDASYAEEMAGTIKKREEKARKKAAKKAEKEGKESTED
ncbi:BCCT family transporter [Eubacterium barkeri]|uniref:Choline-glycine betaine transporter n=1 Tax=Eubacterium barkeri TaxID=1528 RepID=A0A1H3EXX5_EUBBA|nr:BCCT family transporter [Eubacterium barkeri]SDX83460.1 Choline-glycine betaine transporter [Eubacterium barkeri]